MAQATPSTGVCPGPRRGGGESSPFCGAKGGRGAQRRRGFIRPEHRRISSQLPPSLSFQRRGRGSEATAGDAQCGKSRPSHTIPATSVNRGYDNIPSSPTGEGEGGGRGTGFRLTAVKMSEGPMGYVDRRELPQGLWLTALAMAPDWLFRLSVGRAMSWTMSGSRRAVVQSYKGLNVGTLFS